MNNQKDKMSIFGVGPKLAFLTILYSVLMLVFNAFSKIDLSIKIIPYTFLVIFGVILIIIGIPLLIISFITVKKGYMEDFLCMKGVYSMCRHPLYSAWIIFIVPGIVLILCSWELLTIPVIMYFVFRILIKEEESYLENKFGKQFTDYKSKVSLLFPRFWKYKKENGQAQ